MGRRVLSRQPWLFAVLILLLGGLPGAAAGAEVVSGDVFARVVSFSADLERLRRHMGVPKAGDLGLRIRHAAPHDVYFQAVTLFTKVDRLAFELLRLRTLPPPAPAGERRPAHVMAVVEAGQEVLHRVMEDLVLPVEEPPSGRAPDKTPSDVFAAILAANRQLNLLLERRFGPSDVYQQVTHAMGYAARLLSQQPDAVRFPEEPPFEDGKMPSDVFFHLLGCLDDISRIYAERGMGALTLDASQVGGGSITPSDVFDVASLVVARLDFLHRSEPNLAKPRPAYHPRRKFPSDVFQRVGILKAQLRQLTNRRAAETQ